MKSRIEIGTKVYNKRNQEGVITRIITKSTGYVEVTYANGILKKEMAFNLNDENGQQLKATPVKKERVKTTEDLIQDWKKYLLRVHNGMGEHESKQSIIWTLSKVHEEGFIGSLVDAWFKAYYHEGGFSEKQAYYLAKYLVENNL